MPRLALLLVLPLVPVLVDAEMPSERNIKTVADAWLAKKSAPSFGAGMTMAEAARVQELYNSLIAKEFRPFIELPDLVFDPQVKLDGPHLLAVNVAARLGVLGDPIPLPATAESVAKLAEMKIVVLDQTGAMLGGGKGTDVLDNPLNAVLWIAESLRADGKVLKNGNLLSLGSFSALLPPKPGTTVTVRYTGLSPAPAEVKVTFE